LNYLVCNMMKVFTRPTSASDFLLLICGKFRRAHLFKPQEKAKLAQELTLGQSRFFQDY
jgi:hypothetical protein